MSNTNAIANVAKMIRENEIKFVLLRFTDIKGKEHGVSLPVSLVADDLEDLFEEDKRFLYERVYHEKYSPLSF